MKILKIFVLILLSITLSGIYAFAEKEKKEGMGGMMHGGMMGEGMMGGMMHGGMMGGMKEHREGHHKMMNDLMQSVADLAGVVKGSVTDMAAKDKCDAIIAKIGELIKKHDEMMKAHQQKMEEMMKSTGEKK